MEGVTLFTSMDNAADGLPVFASLQCPFGSSLEEVKIFGASPRIRKIRTESTFECDSHCFQNEKIASVTAQKRHFHPDSGFWSMGGHRKSRNASLRT